MEDGSNRREIIIPDPLWGSDLANIILDLEKLRTKHLGGDVPPYIFFQLKDIFHILETLGSARIEGNNTTLSEYVEKIIEQDTPDEQNDEIRNLEKAIRFIEDYTDETTLFDRAFISQLHKILTDNLTPPPKGEGSKNPGELRRHNVHIKQSGHTPPEHFILPEYFESFIEFINYPHKEQYQLLMVAIAHHRFEFIHPFDNGNGRMGRLLNYAFLIKLGFKVKKGRLINPSSVFYTNRDKYYEMLSRADSLRSDDLLSWCEYFLLGLKNEIEKIDSLLDKSYVEKEILFPLLKIAHDQKFITTEERKILEYLVSKDDMMMKSEELSHMGITDSRKKASTMAKLRDKKMIQPIVPNGRIYTIHFVNNYLLRGIMNVLQQKGFVSDFLNTK
ncbi:Fic family protein [Wolinella succinogenes]|nr:Fic family protein [Wolinella succinogenes]VEG80138.1 mobile mystery protein B [Wolinella succinogenes]VEG82436.1 mobile mystery protein B [Wolinella succinogenes]HCZ18245.1 Fic family protein [Helicobacter sp.]